MSKKNKLTTTLLNVSQKLVPVESFRKQAGKRLIAQFAESLGWVYFGHVDQHRDEHVLVRGFTASAKHYDTHYCVGTIGDYEVILLQRTDAVSSPGKPGINYRWMILQLELKTKNHPHLFATSVGHAPIFYEYFFTKHYHFRQAPASTWREHSAEFQQHFTVFASQDKLHEAPVALPPHITATLGAHFQGLEFELKGNMLYLYTSNHQITVEVLERMVKHGAWLAHQFDMLVSEEE